MAWIAVGFDLETGQVDAMADRLLVAGAVSVDIADAAAGTEREKPLFGEPGTEPVAWPRSRMVALFEPRSDYRAIVAAALAEAGIGDAAALSVETVPDQDWVRATQSQFAPICVSERLWIVPSWCDAPNPRAINLRLDPGIAFGTGGHPTTWQCLRWLDANLGLNQEVVDYGCGSGVLAIAAKRLGARRVVAVDIDPDALRATAMNARANEVDIEVTLPDEVPPGPYDLVLANILAKPLMVLAPLLADLVRPGGNLVLAGILSAQAEPVCAAYRAWCDLSVYGEREGWTCLSGLRKLP